MIPKSYIWCVHAEAWPFGWKTVCRPNMSVKRYWLNADNSYFLAMNWSSCEWDWCEGNNGNINTTYFKAALWSCLCSDTSGQEPLKLQVPASSFTDRIQLRLGHVMRYWYAFLCITITHPCFNINCGFDKPPLKLGCMITYIRFIKA